MENSLLGKSVSVIKQRELLYAEICFKKTVKKDLLLCLKGIFFPYNWEWRAGGSFLIPSWCCGFLHSIYSSLKVTLSYRHSKDPPGWLEKNEKKIKENASTVSKPVHSDKLSNLVHLQKAWEVTVQRDEAGPEPFPVKVAEYLHCFHIYSLKQFLSKQTCWKIWARTRDFPKGLLLWLATTSAAVWQFCGAFHQNQVNKNSLKWHVCLVSQGYR